MSPGRRRIGVVTGTRADYGLIYWILKAIAADNQLTLRLLVTGAHLEPRFGETWKAIVEDGFAIDHRIPMGLAGDSPADIAAALGRCVEGFARALTADPVDILILVGDRYEMFGAAQAAMLCRVPIAHIYGGERTEASIDDAMRHAMTKMAHLHFTATEAYRWRVVQMGEDPRRVFNFGGPALDYIARLGPVDLSEIESAVGMALGDGFLLATYHPVTLAADGGSAALDELLTALDAFPALRIVFTGVNADPARDRLALRLGDYASSRPERVRMVASLGQRRYLGAMRRCLAVVGNSSSGIIEAPALHVPTVNIGDRQKGRLRASSVIDCVEERGAIRAAIAKALSPKFRAAIADAPSPYGEGGASEKIVAVLRLVEIEGLIRKTFYDLPETGRPG